MALGFGEISCVSRLELWHFSTLAKHVVKADRPSTGPGVEECRSCLLLVPLVSQEGATRKWQCEICDDFLRTPLATVKINSPSLHLVEQGRELRQDTLLFPFGQSGPTRVRPNDMDVHCLIRYSNYPNVHRFPFSFTVHCTTMAPRVTQFR